MTMQTRTWPYGTRKPVEVIQVFRDLKKTVLMCQDTAPAPGVKPEGYVCMYAGCVYPGVGIGDRGTLVFTEGGPTGGYWAYEPAAAAGGAQP